MLDYRQLRGLADSVMLTFIVLFTCDSCFCTIIMAVNKLVKTNVRRLFSTFLLRLLRPLCLGLFLLQFLGLDP